MTITPDGREGAASAARPSGPAEQFAQGIGGRLSEPKSEAYVDAVGRVEARATPFVARYMLASDLAYALSALEIGVLPPEPGQLILQGTLELLEDSTPITQDGTSDVVVAREAWLADRFGPVVGSWAHLGRNRGESLRSYLPRLFFRHVLHDEAVALLELIDVLLKRADPVMEAVAPAYHHLQHAYISTLGEYLLSWARMCLPHLERLRQSGERLGIAPPTMTGRRVVVDLADRTARRLGFERRAPIRREAMWGEDQFLEPFWVLVLISVDLARLAEDLRLWMTPEFGFFELADRHASGSSAYPQKKNPFGLQTVIGGASMGAGRLAAQLSASITPSDQSDALFHAGSLYQHALDIVAWTRFMAEVVRDGAFDLDTLRKKATVGWAGAGEAHDVLVFEQGVPFRIAHHVLGALVRADATGAPLPDLARLVEELTGKAVPIDTEEMAAIVRGERIPPEGLAIDAGRAALAETQAHVQQAREELAGPSVTDAAIDRLVREARQWLSAPDAGGRLPPQAMRGAAS